MKMDEIKAQAKVLGVRAGRMNKRDLIRAIQVQEGNFPCFGTADQGHCDQAACSWRAVCLPARAS